MEGSTDCVVGVDSIANVKPSCGSTFNVIARISLDFSGMYSSLLHFQTKAIMAYTFWAADLSRKSFCWQPGKHWISITPTAKEFNGTQCNDEVKYLTWKHFITCRWTFIWKHLTWHCICRWTSESLYLTDVWWQLPLLRSLCTSWHLNLVAERGYMVCTF